MKKRTEKIIDDKPHWFCTGDGGCEQWLPIFSFQTKSIKNFTLCTPCRHQYKHVVAERDRSLMITPSMQFSQFMLQQPLLIPADRFH